MVRTQIQLTEEQAAQLKELAHESNESIAAIIESPGPVSGQTATWPPHPPWSALSVVGKYRAGAPDVSIEHDRYLEEEDGS